jgi:hypothetical protein
VFAVIDVPQLEAVRDRARHMALALEPGKRLGKEREDIDFHG